MINKRWYDKDPILKEALELFAQSEQQEKPKQMLITTLEVAL